MDEHMDHSAPEGDFNSAQEMMQKLSAASVATTPTHFVHFVGKVYRNNVDARLSITSFDKVSQCYRVTERLQGRVTSLEVQAALVVARVKNNTWHLAPEPNPQPGDIYVSTTSRSHRLISLVRVSGNVMWHLEQSDGDGCKTEQNIMVRYVSNWIKGGTWFRQTPMQPAAGAALTPEARAVASAVAAGVAYGTGMQVTGGGQYSAPADLKAYEADAHLDADYRCPRCRTIGTLPRVLDPMKLEGCTSCGEYVPLAERIDVRPPVTVVTAVASDRAKVDQILAEDARQHPAFAEARRAAVVAALKDAFDMSGSGPATVPHLLKILHAHEDTRGAGRLSEDIRERREKFAYPILFRVYERVRTMGSRTEKPGTRNERAQVDAPAPPNRAKVIAKAFPVEQDIAKVFR
jgi:hypothetical protein